MKEENEKRAYLFVWPGKGKRNPTAVISKSKKFLKKTRVKRKKRMPKKDEGNSCCK